MNLRYEKKKMQILLFFKTIPIVTTEQISIFFTEYKQPSKRASEFLLTLKEEKLIEGRRRKGKSKCWRLSKKGRELFEINQRPVPFNSRQLEHFLSIGDVYLSLFFTGKLSFFELEKKIDFLSENKEILKYSPDAFFRYDDCYYFLEVQRTPISKEKWNEKWMIASEFFKSEFIRQKSEFSFLHKLEKLPIVVITNQPKQDIYTSNENLALSIHTSCEEFLDSNHFA